MRLNRLFLLPTALIAMAGTGAQASNLRFYFTPSELAGVQNSILTFSGHLENLGSTELFLNDSSLVLAGNGLTTNDDPFVFNAPYSLPKAGTKSSGGALLDRWEGDLFTVKIGRNVKPATYFGYFLIRGGSSDSASEVLGRQDFQVTVTQNPVPEPGTVAFLTALGSLGAGLVLCRRSRRA